MFIILLYLFMINPALLSTNLTGLVGISPNQPYNPAYQVLDAANMSSRSGYWITDNPFCKVELIKDTQDYEGIATTDFNNWLRTKLNTSAINIANWVFNESDVVDEQFIYINALNKISGTPTTDKNAEGNYVNCYDLPPGFNCYWMQPSKEKNVAFRIPSVNLEFNGTGTLTLYLFNTADVTTPLFSQVINITGPFMSVQLLDKNNQPNGWVCDNTAGAGYKGDYYLGYITEECTGNLKPFKREYRESNILANIQYIDYVRWNFPAFTGIGEPFDLLQFASYVLYNGLNPNIIVYEDFTSLISRNEKMFARAIQLHAQMTFMSEYAASIRSNRNERMAAEMIMQIEGVSGDGVAKVQGLKSQLFGAVGQIKKEIEKLKTGNESRPRISVRTVTA